MHSPTLVYDLFPRYSQVMDEGEMVFQQEKRWLTKHDVSHDTVLKKRVRGTDPATL